MPEPDLVKFKEVYPAYKDMPNDELLRKVLASDKATEALRQVYYPKMSADDFVGKMREKYSDKPVVKTGEGWEKKKTFAEQLPDALSRLAPFVPGKVTAPHLERLVPEYKSDVNIRDLPFKEQLIASGMGALRDVLGVANLPAEALQHPVQTGVGFAKFPFEQGKLLTDAMAGIPGAQEELGRHPMGALFAAGIGVQGFRGAKGVAGKIGRKGKVAPPEVKPATFKEAGEPAFVETPKLAEMPKGKSEIEKYEIIARSSKDVNDFSKRLYAYLTKREETAFRKGLEGRGGKAKKEFADAAEDVAVGVGEIENVQGQIAWEQAMSTIEKKSGNVDEFIKQAKAAEIPKPAEPPKAEPAPITAPKAKELGLHRPVTVEGGAARLHDLTPAFGEDIYSKNAVQYFGTGDKLIDTQTINILKSLRGRPEAEVIVYRAVPKDIPVKSISEGDWVTVNKGYAEKHGETTLGGNYKIIQQKVKAKDLTTNADSFNEQGYYPDLAKAAPKAEVTGESGSLGLMATPEVLKGIGADLKETMLDAHKVAVELTPNKNAKRLAKIIDVEHPFKEVGAPETGFHIKNIGTEQTMHEVKAIDLTKNIVRWGWKKSGKNKEKFNEYMSDVVIEAEKVKPSQEHLRPAVEKVKGFFRNAQEEYKRLGVNVNFKENSIAHFNDKIVNLEGGLSKKVKGEKRTAILDEIKEHKDAIKKLEEMEFVHIPVALWFEKLTFSNPAKAGRILKILAKQKRKTLTIQDLIDSGAITKGDLHIADVLMSYGRRMGRDMAMLKVLKAAKQEGLSKSAWQINEKTGKWEVNEKLAEQYKNEGLVTLPPWSAGITRGYYHLEPFAKYLDSYVNAMGKSNTWQRFLSTVKMAQFYNPIFLPMYDVVQAAMAGAIIHPKAPLYAVKAWKSKKYHDAEFWEFMEHGAPSKPFGNPLRNFNDVIENLKHTPGEVVINHLKSYTNVFKPHQAGKAMIKDVYNASWNTAWWLDELVRLHTFHYLKDKGFSPRESAQITAKFHADYASVPPNLRRGLNQIFFTPTFKIAMGKLYYEMLMGTTKLGTKGGRQYAKGLALTFGVVQGFDSFMTQGMGYKRDQWGRRYTKEVETDDGTKELVLVWSTPANIWFKYIARAAYAVKMRDAGAFLQSNKWEFHPFYRVMWDSFSEKFLGEYAFDDMPKRVGKTATFMLKEYVRILNIVSPSRVNEQKTRRDKKVLDKEFGVIGHKLLSLVVFGYTRNTEDKRKYYRTMDLMEDFRRLDHEGMSKERAKEVMDNYIKKVNKIWEIENE